MASHKTAALAAAVLALSSTASARAGEIAGGVIGCDASGNKQIAGAVIGGVLGGVIGNNIVKKDQQAGTIIGATAGAATGSYVGCQMQKSDARDPAPRTASAPRTAPLSRSQPAYLEDERRWEDERRYAYRDGGPVYAVSDPGPKKRHPHGMPPGQAKKYGVGERMPVSYVNDRQYFIEPGPYRLRPPPAGYRWVVYGPDAYLVRTETGLVADVVRALIR